jgi:hypothetical protein
MFSAFSPFKSSTPISALNGSASEENIFKSSSCSALEKEGVMKNNNITNKRIVLLGG